MTRLGFSAPRLAGSLRPASRLRFVLCAGYMWLLVVALLLLSGCGSVSLTRGADGADGFAPAQARAEIRGVMDAQVAAWNAGDTAAFMDGYVRRDSLRFASGGSVTYGWSAMLERYRTSYPDRAAMGTLDFRDLDIDVLGPQHAVVFGSWHLARGTGSDQPDVSGLFTLLFERVAGTDAGADGAAAWRITHDHTSSAR